MENKMSVELLVVGMVQLTFRGKQVELLVVGIAQFTSGEFVQLICVMTACVCVMGFLATAVVKFEERVRLLLEGSSKDRWEGMV